MFGYNCLDIDCVVWTKHWVKRFNLVVRSGITPDIFYTLSFIVKCWLNHLTGPLIKVATIKGKMVKITCVDFVSNQFAP